MSYSWIGKLLTAVAAKKKIVTRGGDDVKFVSACRSHNSIIYLQSDDIYFYYLVKHIIYTNLYRVYK